MDRDALPDLRPQTPRRRGIGLHGARRVGMAVGGAPGRSEHARPDGRRRLPHCAEVRQEGEVEAERPLLPHQAPDARDLGLVRARRRLPPRR
jgi:hypothetical protein